MAFTPTNYLTAAQAVGQMRTDATAADGDVTRAIETLVGAVNRLSGLSAAWGPAVTFIRDQAAAESGSDTRWRDLEREMDRYIADFGTMESDAISVRDAAQSARNS